MKKHWLSVKKNSANNKNKCDTIRDTALVDYYESMRAYVDSDNKTGGLPMGLDLFLKKGMKCWVDAWHSTAMIQTAIRDNIERASAIIPDAVIPDMVVLITQLLLGAKEEKRVYG